MVTRPRVTRLGQGVSAHLIPHASTAVQVVDLHGASRWTAAPRLVDWRVSLPASRPAVRGSPVPATGASLILFIASIVPSDWRPLWLGLAGAGLLLRRRRRSTGLLRPALAGFFTMIVGTMSTALPVYVFLGTAASLTSSARVHVRPPQGQMALPSAVPSGARKVARPATPRVSAASGTGALKATLLR